ncbi:MAG: UDP-glucose--hexose-1-phosphate uridylyltransferase [Flavobacterium sp.]
MLPHFDQNLHPHRRYNPLLDEWILVSPHRTNRPWQGQKENVSTTNLPSYDPTCYLCPDNTRSNGEKNPDYTSCYVFDNDFAALLKEEVISEANTSPFFNRQPERGINRVVCFSPKHHLTIPEMEINEIEDIISVWQDEYTSLGAIDYINYVQIFENKGAVMGCSNPHPHGQIWAQSSLPTQILKTQNNLKKYYDVHQRSMLLDYVNAELDAKERIVFENNDFVVLVPFWATWPYETMILSKRHLTKITDFSSQEKKSFAEAMQHLTIKYDNLFETSFPYSAGIHQSPTDGEAHPEWHFHVHFYPPLLRSASVKKFMVGYEMLAETQRDLNPEKSAEILRSLPSQHYKK